jgi:hypothetical protein
MKTEFKNKRLKEPAAVVLRSVAVPRVTLQALLFLTRSHRINDF